MTDSNQRVRGWAHHTEGPSPYHVWPLGDAVPHDIDEEDNCICGPTTEPVNTDQGAVNWLITHHSLDGREQNERNMA